MITIHQKTIVCLFGLFLIFILFTNGFSWNPVNGFSICTIVSGSPHLVSDSTGGVIVALLTTPGIGVQRVDSNGSTLWSLNGIDICTATGQQGGQQIISDGAGGAIIAWVDGRGGSLDIYVQRINSSGSILWTLNGVSISTSTTINMINTGLQLVSDGANGAIITWFAFNNLGFDYGDIYAQRINSNGSTLWATNGLSICTMYSIQDFPQIASDGAGGAFIAWEDYRSALHYDIYAQHVNSAGSITWALNGIPICTTNNFKNTSRIIPDNSGGAIITWVDYRNDSGSTTNSDIYAQRVNNSGSALWALNGIAICTAANNQNNPRVAASGAGDLFITWNDYRNTTANPIQKSDIYAQKVNSSGSLLWMLNGVAVCTSNNNQIVSGNVLSLNCIVSDESGGAIVTWEDQRGSTTNTDIYVQRIDNTGSTLWITDGFPICTDTSNQVSTQLISDGAGGAILAWQDPRGSWQEVYVQRIYSNGSITPAAILRWQDYGR